ncbi:MAG: UDP-N-acetylmuramate:L-alanyl-gamma-D-glutamyl-meso-diaminopimelate ligase [Desulfobulbaceae bacterium]|uniref:UDP-N-acetylmuramate--L-alanine ligase n=1 Tax=Candidatus Desulfatifera sulfidica TaxID=2841691 RepID=A0A8J6N6U1_9BACT|nr:UDP-N-acetylmuramate:L-alanyl-gamma-D-glutamyl-meso-diaminopimelate ligase [Candidatus Desulfatifera sulfidica]
MNALDPAMNQAPRRIHHIHIMGIGGTGMAAMAGMLKQSGYQISGSDLQVYPPMSDFLAAQNIPVMNGYSEINLEPQPDLVIVGNVIRQSNPEAQALARLGLPYLSMPQALGHFFLNKRRSLVVAGTHGKTTTSSLLASCLYGAKKDPSCLIGGIVQEFGANFHIGEGPDFVVEGDEYDTAFFDKGSKFLHYQPQVAIITSLEFDHADIFADLEAIKDSFRKFVALMPKDGLIIAHLDDANVAEVVSEAPCEIQGYGLGTDMHWRLSDLSIHEQYSRFSIHHREENNGEKALEWDRMQVALPGRHNCLNALAVTAALHHLGLSQAEINTGLSNFSGVKRRQEVRGKAAGVTVIDDFAHHPTAVRETLSALRAAYPGNRLICIFEPRTNSSRRSIFQQDYVNAFDAADMALIREPLPLDNIAPEEQFSSAQLSSDLRKRGIDATSFPDTNAILAELDQCLKPGDVAAIFSNGGFDNIHTRLLSQLERRELS